MGVRHIPVNGCHIPINGGHIPIIGCHIPIIGRHIPVKGFWVFLMICISIIFGFFLEFSHHRCVHTANLLITRDSRCPLMVELYNHPLEHLDGQQRHSHVHQI